MITSVHNPRIQAVRKLMTQSKARRERGEFVVEGVRLAEEALQAGWEAKLVLYTEGLDLRGQAIVGGFAARGVSVEQVTAAVMDSISQTETPQGLLGVIAHRALPRPAMPEFLLILDGIRDPGNLGSILRTAAAAAVQAVMLAPGCADPWSPKVLRAGMGAHFRLPIESKEWQEIRSNFTQAGDKLHVFLADSTVGTPYSQADFLQPAALIIGGEAEGAGSEAHSLAQEKVCIPMPGGSESLNAAAAASILLFEVQRQRSGG